MRYTTSPPRAAYLSRYAPATRWATACPIRARACRAASPGIIYGLRNYGGFEAEQLEWHGHNDFYKAVANSGTAWLYGAARVNCSLLGIGERTGNTPLEAMVMEYAQIRGTLDGMDTTVIRDIADYYEKVIGYRIPPNTPFVGESFNTTQAGIHADGLLKDEEIYNIFDTAKILKSPPKVGISRNSGAAGIAVWLAAASGREVSKHDAAVDHLHDWVDAQYESGRVTNIGDAELAARIREVHGGGESMNIAQKLINSHLVHGDMTPGSEIAIRIDQTLTQDSTGTMAYLQFEAMGIDKVKTSAPSPT